MRHLMALLSPRVLTMCVFLCSVPSAAPWTASRARPVQDDAPPAYTVRDLGTIPDSQSYFGNSLSNAGHVVGRFFGPTGAYHGFLWRDGVMIDLGSLGGGVTQALGVSDAGVVVGLSASSSGAEHAFVYHDGRMFDLGTFGGTNSLASAINDHGVVAGGSQRRRGRQHREHAAFWAAGSAADLGTLGGELSEALGINDAGRVVGWAQDSARRQRAFLWTPGGSMIDLGDLGGPSACAVAINNAGQVVGAAKAAGDSFGTEHAFLWENGVMLDLGVLPEAGREGPFGPELVNTTARAINDAAQIVGNSSPGRGPFLWQDGAMRNLNDLIDPASGWTIVEANDINDSGQIAGTALSASGDIRAVVLTPAS